MLDINEYMKDKNIEIAKEILNDLNIEYFLVEESYDESLISCIQEFNPELIKSNINKIIDFIGKLTKEDKELLSKYNGKLGEDENWLEGIIRIVHYTITYPDLFDLCDWGENGCGEYVPIKLKDPFYSFNELESLLKLKEALYLNEDLFFNELYSIMYDYATYSIGGYNSELREEFMSIYEDYFLPYLKKSKEISDDFQKIIKLKEYKKLLTKYENRKTILELLKTNEILLSNNSLKIEYIKMQQENSNGITSIPSKYNSIDKIDNALSILLNK